MNIVNSSVWPELSRSFGRADIAAARELHRRACQASVWIATGCIVILSFLGPWLLQVWTRGAIEMHYSSYLMLLLSMLVNAVWFTSSVVQASINQHQRMALVFALGNCVFVVAAAFLAPFYGLSGVAGASLILEVGMALVVLPRSLVLLNDDLRSFLRSMVVSPSYLFNGR